MSEPPFSLRSFSASSDLVRKHTDRRHVSTICSYTIKIITLEIKPPACWRQLLKKKSRFMALQVPVVQDVMLGHGSPAEEQSHLCILRCSESQTSGCDAPDRDELGHVISHQGQW